MPLRYGAIYVDPPWQYENWSEAGEGRNAKSHYDCMPIEELCELPVSHLASKDCALFMWCVGELLPEALEVVQAWNFTYKSVAFDWTKISRKTGLPAIGLGYTTRKTNEQCLLGFTGEPERLDAGVPQGLLAPRRQHSRKPDEFYSRIERLYAGPYLELFARQSRPGWDSWGNEVGKFEAVA